MKPQRNTRMLTDAQTSSDLSVVLITTCTHLLTRLESATDVAKCLVECLVGCLMWWPQTDLAEGTTCSRARTAQDALRQ
jgi:hypothetical protein